MDSSAHISTHVDACGRGFVSLAEALPNNAHFAEQIRPETVKDEFDRFRIWAGNIAAHRKGRRSLEYRLRDAAHLRTEAHSLLTALQGSLQDALAIVNGERTPWDEFSDCDTDSESDVEVSSDAGGHDLQGNTELKQIFANTKNAVTCLFRLSMAIRDPAPNSQSRSTITVDKSFHEKHDIDHVKAKFSINPSFLAERLGRAISGRRQYLNYREQHHQKLMKNVEKIGFEEPKTEHTVNSTEASPIPKGTATDHDVLDDEALSQTSYAPSENATIRVPPLPKDARRKEHFECPLCFMIVSIHSTAAWKQHVYRDLHPYSCTFENCTTADRLYDSRSAWFKHELEAHRTSWQCVDGCGAIFQSERSFTVHVRTHHPDLADSELLSALKKTSSKSANLSDYAQCPLCAERMTLHALQKHLGRHQEQLALFALPPNLDATEEDAPDESGPPVDKGKWQDEELSDISDSAEFDELSALVNDLPNQACESEEALELDMNSRILHAREDSRKLQERTDAKKAALEQHPNERGDDSRTEPVDQFPLAAAPNSQPRTLASDNDSLPAFGGLFQESDAQGKYSDSDQAGHVPIAAAQYSQPLLTKVDDATFQAPTNTPIAGPITSYEPIAGPIHINPLAHQAHVEDVLEASSEEKSIVASSAINPTSMESTAGCKTCLKRKQRCDRSQPTCDACLRDGVDCEGYNDQINPPYVLPPPYNRQQLPHNSLPQRTARHLASIPSIRVTGRADSEGYAAPQTEFAAFDHPIYQPSAQEPQAQPLNSLTDFTDFDSSYNMGNCPPPEVSPTLALQDPQHKRTPRGPYEEGPGVVQPAQTLRRGRSWSTGQPVLYPTPPPLSLSFNGDMEGRTLQINPAEGGMADIVIGNSTI